jgi:hypothetical protein
VRALLAACVVSILVSACSSSSSPPDSTGDCITVCNNDSQLMCTDVTNCTNYCDEIEGVATSGSCQTQVNAYVACAKAAKVCSAKSSCSSQASDFSSCAAQYCDANTTDTNCVALSDSF